MERFVTAHIETQNADFSTPLFFHHSMMQLGEIKSVDWVIRLVFDSNIALNSNRRYSMTTCGQDFVE